MADSTPAAYQPQQGHSLGTSRGQVPWASHGLGWLLPLAGSPAWDGCGSGVLGFHRCLCIISQQNLCLPSNGCMALGGTWQPVSTPWGPGAQCQPDSQLLSHHRGHSVTVRSCPCPGDWKLAVLLLLTLGPAVPGTHDSSGLMLPARSTCLSPLQREPTTSIRQLWGLHVNHSKTWSQHPLGQDQAGSRNLAPSSQPKVHGCLADPCSC